MKSINSRNMVVALLAVGVLTVVAQADPGSPWLPNWTAVPGYTSQFWEFNDVGGAEPVQPLAPDVYSENSYGAALASWVNDTGGMVSWTDIMMGGQPDWTTGSYGGMVNWAPFEFGATVPTGSAAGSLLVFVQYDWYAYPGANCSPSIAGASDITPAGYYDYEIGLSGSGNPWYRTSKLFELPANAGSVDIDFAASGFVTGIESFSVTTAVGDAGALVPAAMPVPEPATVGLLLTGSLVGLRKRK